MKKYKSIYEAKKIKYKGAEFELIPSKSKRPNVIVTFYWPKKFHKFSNPIDIFEYKDISKAKRTVDIFNKMIANDEKIGDIYHHISLMSTSLGV